MTSNNKPTKPLARLKEEIANLLEDGSLETEEIIGKLNQLHLEVSENPTSFPERKSAEIAIDNAIEEVFAVDLES